MSALATVCPAASPTGPPSRPSVICGVLANANQGAALDGLARRGQVSPLLDGDGAADTIATACAGCAVPGSDGPTYTACAIWRADKHRMWAGRAQGPDGLRDHQAIRQGRLRPDRDVMREMVAATQQEA